MRRIGAVLGMLLAAAVVSASARASASGAVSATLNEAGGGSLIANGDSNPPDQTWSWQICNAAGVACSPGPVGRHIETGAPAAGTTFRATSNTGVSGLSPVWNGPLHVAVPPTITGAVRADELVTTVPGTWAGGWTGDFEQTQISACPTKYGTGCITLTSTKFPSSCSTQAAVIDPDFTGWYLRVAAVVYGPDTAFATIGYTTLYGSWPYADSPWKAGPRTTVATVARVAPAAGPRTSSCGPPALVPGLPPEIAVEIHAASLARDGSAAVQCFGVCTVELHASSHGRFAETRSRKQGETQLRISPRALSRLKGPIRYTLFVQGHRVAQRTAKAEVR